MNGEEAALVGSTDSTRIGIMGGTFDPPHFGHLDLARGVMRELALDRVLFMPTGNPNFKQGQRVTPAAQRVDMVRLAIAGEEGFELDEREVRRGGVTYTVDTLIDLHRELSDGELFFIIGADSAATLVHWRRADELATLATFAAVQRPGYDFARIRAALDACPHAYRMRYLEIDTPDISSTQLRELVAAGESLDGLTPQPVVEYIADHGLYR